MQTLNSRAVLSAVLALTVSTLFCLSSLTTFASNNELVAIDPTPALGEPEQDIGDAATGEEPPGGVDPDELLKYATRELG